MSTISELIHSAKTAATVAITTTTTGLGTFLELIPNDIGKLATLVGIILSLVLIRTHWRRGNIEFLKTQLEMEIMRQQEAERLAKALERKASGLPARRGDDG